MTGTKKTIAQYVVESRRRAIAKGAQRLPDGLLTPEAAAALDALLAAGWASSRAQIVNRALVEAQKAGYSE